MGGRQGTTQWCTPFEERARLDSLSVSLPGLWSTTFALVFRDHVGMLLWLLVFSALSLQARGKFFPLGQKCFWHKPQVVSLANCPLQFYHSSPPVPCSPFELSSGPYSLLRWAPVLTLPSLPSTPHLQHHGHGCVTLQKSRILALVETLTDLVL